MSTQVLLAPTENALAEKLGDLAITSSIPEQKGADILIYAKPGLVGIQRKEIPHDFISSMTDGRLTRETGLLVEKCAFSLVMLEGKFRYYPDTTLDVGRKNPSKYKKSQVTGMLLDISLVRGIPIMPTDDIDDSVTFIKTLMHFVGTDKHLGLYARPNVKGAWYVPTADEIHLWLLQGFPGVGAQLAENIIKHFGGKMPLAWTCTMEELMAVPKIGEGKASEMFRLLGHEVITKAKRVKQVEEVPSETAGKLSAIEQLRAKLLIRARSSAMAETYKEVYGEGSE